MKRPCKYRLKNKNGKFTLVSAHIPEESGMGPTSQKTVSKLFTKDLNQVASQRPFILRRPPVTKILQPHIDLSTHVKESAPTSYDPANFHIPLAGNENEVIGLTSVLNERTNGQKKQTSLSPLARGHIEYSSDHTVSRDITKGVLLPESFEVEVLDHSNTAIVNGSKVYSVNRELLTIPRLGMYSFLRRIRWNEPTEMCKGKIADYFSLGVINRIIACEFLKTHDEKWEVNITCGNKCVIKKLLSWSPCSKLQELAWQTPQAISHKLSILENSHSKARRVNLYDGSVIFTPLSQQLVSTELVRYGQLEEAKMIYASKTGGFHLKLLKNQKTSDLARLIPKEDNSLFLSMDNIKRGLEFLSISKRDLKWYQPKTEEQWVHKKVFVFLINHGQHEVVPVNNTKVLSREIRSILRQGVSHEWICFTYSKKMILEFIVCLFAHLKMSITALRYLDDAREVEMLVDGMLLCWYLNVTTSLVEENKLRSSGTVFSLESQTLLSPWVIQPFIWAPFQNGRRYGGIATVVDDPSDFCVQLEDFFYTVQYLFTLLADLPEPL